MRNIITEYISKNGLRFHHSISVKKDSLTDSLLPESHQMCEIILMISGSVTYKIDGQSYKLSPFDAIIIHPNKLHTREIDTDSPYERMVLHFSPNLLPSFADLNLLSNFTDSFLPSLLPKKIIRNTNLIDLFNKCEDLCKNQNNYTDLRLVGLILQIIETLNETILKLDKSNENLPIRVDKLSHECIKYVNQNLTNKENLSLENISKHLFVSVSHLQHSFKKQIGISLHSYITNQKMQLARNLLMQGQSPNDVASLLRYDYYSTFYHAFIRRFGYPPKTFKK